MKGFSFTGKSMISAGLCGKRGDRFGLILALWLSITVGIAQKRSGVIRSKGGECGGKMKSF
jgi:hypothetical protein